MGLKTAKYFLAFILIISILVVAFSGDAYAATTCYVKQTTCSPTVNCGTETDATKCAAYSIAETAPACSIGNTEMCMLGCCCGTTGVRSQITRGTCEPGARFGEGILAASCSNYCQGIVPQANITGTVTDAAGHILQYVNVSISSTIKTVTNSIGGYKLDNVNAGTYIILAQWNRCSNSSEVRLGSSNVNKNIVITCNTYSVSGYVRDSSGNIVGNAGLFATVNNVPYTAISNPTTGVYTISGITQDSVFSISAVKDGCQGTVDIISPLIADYTKANIIISCNNWSIRGTVRDDGSPRQAVVNAKVTTNRGGISMTNPLGVYSISSIPEGNITVTATSSSNLAGGITHSCQKTLPLELTFDNKAFDINMDCCDMHCFENICDNGIITTTCTKVSGTCASASYTTTRPCSASPACQWKCDVWSACDASGQHSRTCSNTSWPTDGCDMSIPIEKPPLTEECHGPCGNGILEPSLGEDCDYGSDIGTYNVSAQCYSTWLAAAKANDPTLTDADFPIASMTPSTCHVDTCKCRDPPTKEASSCVTDPGNLSSLQISWIDRQHAFNLTWSLINDGCKDYVKTFTLTRSENVSGVIGSSVIIDGSINKLLRSYLHANKTGDPITIEANKGYCYTLTAIFNDSVYQQSPPKNRESSITRCITAGDEECMDGHLGAWCSGNNDVSICQSNGSIKSTPCEPKTYCSIVNNNATCISQGGCDMCNNIFGLFSYQGIRPMDGSNFVICPSLKFPAPTSNPNSYSGSVPDTSEFGCYADYSMTTLDSAYKCEDVTSCYSYLSQDACESDRCQKFNRSSGNSCEWAQYTTIPGTINIFGKGICRPKDKTEQDCSLCNNPKYNRLGSTDNGCTKDICSLFGYCFFDGNSGTSGTGGSCVDGKTVTCDMYATSDDCIGVAPNDKNMSVDVTWDFAAGTKTGGTNTIFYRSSDVAGLGVCRWFGDDTDSNVACARDADNDHNPGGDCHMDTRDAQLMCNRDVRAPNTTIKNRSVYGLDMDMTGEISVIDDNPWPLGDSRNEADNKITMYYCIAPQSVSTPSIKIFDNPTIRDYSTNNNIMLNVCPNVDSMDKFCQSNGYAIGFVGAAIGSGAGGECMTYNLATGWSKSGGAYTKAECHAYINGPATTTSTCYPDESLKLASASDAYVAHLGLFKDSAGHLIDGSDDNNNFTMYYFSEDPAKNLEVIKNFKFTLDALPPKPILNTALYTFNISKGEWLSNLSISISVNASENSWPVECTFSLRPVSTDIVATISFMGKDRYDIPSKIPPHLTTIYSSTGSLSTIYPELIDGRYAYELDCIDAAKNQYKNSSEITIDGDLSINSPSPAGQTFTSTGFKALGNNISINTSQPGRCKYSPTSNANYTAMEYNFSEGTGDGTFHSSTVQLQPNNASRIYKYYVSCNLTINGQPKIVRGDDVDSVYFAIDDLGPKTTLMYDSTTATGTVAKPYDYSVQEKDEMYLSLACDDNDTKLRAPSGMNMAFGCSDDEGKGRHYCIPLLDKSNNCTSDFNDYIEIGKEGKIHLDYSRQNSTDKAAYGNYPTIYYYSEDAAGNIDNSRLGFAQLRIKNKNLDDPDVTFKTDIEDILYDPTVQPTISTARINISIDYSGFENSVSLNASLKFIDTSTTDIPIILTRGNNGAKYSISAQYFNNGQYLLTLDAVDDDGNAKQTLVRFTVDHANNTVHLVSPLLGIGQSQAYAINVSTDYDSRCRYSMDSLSTYPSLASKYDEYIDFDVTGNMMHAINNFNGASGGAAYNPLYVICKTTGSLSDADSSFATKSFPVGYNTSSPGVSITFINKPYTFPTDNKIINASYNSTVIQVFTDQLSVCWITNNENHVVIYGLQTGNMPTQGMFIHGNIVEDQDNYSTYGMVHNITLNYSDRLGLGVLGGIFRYNITCVSAAQRSSVQSTFVNLTLDNDNPVLTTTVDNTYITKKYVNVVCTDHSGCTDRYEYRINADMSTPCNPLQAYSGTKLYTEAIEMTSSGKLCLKGYDILGNAGTSDVNVDVADFDSGNIAIKEPFSYTDNNGIYKYVYSNTSIFRFTVQTDVDAQCRYIKSSGLTSLAATPAGIYTIAIPFDADANNSSSQGTGTSGTVHSVNAFRINTIQNFYKGEGWVIICNASSVAPGTDSYIRRELFFYWDDTAPAFTSINITPKSIYDWNNKETLRFVVNTDDYSTCMMNGTPFESNDLARFDSYKTSHEYNYSVVKSLGSDALYRNINTTTDIQFNITCGNRAALWSAPSPQPTIHYEINKTLKLTLLSGTSFNVTLSSSGLASVPVTVSTNIMGTCTLFVDDANAGVMPTTDRLMHSVNIPISPGIHKLRVDCNVPEHSGITPDTTGDYYIYSDMANPTITLSGQAFTCSLKGLRVDVNLSDDISVAGYYYRITGQGASGGSDAASGTIVPWTFRNITGQDVSDSIYTPSNVTLQDGQKYTISAQAVDAAGKTSTVSSISIVALAPFAGISCDITPPTISISDAYTPYLDLALLNVTCSDTESGCTNTYRYKLIDLSEDCNPADPQSTYGNAGAYADALTVDSSGNLCIYGTDNNNNVAYAQRSVNISSGNYINISVKDPGDGSVMVIYPDTIATNVSIFNITLGTSVSAECRYSKTLPQSSNMTDLFTRYIPFDSTNSTAHSINGFDTQNIYEQYLSIICRSDGMLQHPYSRALLRVIYVTSAPAVNMYIVPSTVDDWNSRKAQLSVTTDTDTICIITSSVNPNTIPDANTPYFSGNVSDASTYSRQHYMDLAYDPSTISPSSFTYYANCLDFRRVSGSASANLSYEMSSALNITVLSPTYYKTSTADFIVATSLISGCSLSLNNLSKGVMIQDSSGENHMMRLYGLSDGIYYAKINCSTQITNLQASTSYNITINTTAQKDYCGDGILNVSRGEQCDGANLNGITCASFTGYNYSGGILKCNSDCTFDRSQCDAGSGYCGDGKLEGPNSNGQYEMCDGSVPSWMQCTNFGFDTGLLGCTSCQINTSRCAKNGIQSSTTPSCGNSLMESGEMCEVGTAYNITCAFFDYDYGTTSCSVSSQCIYDITSCRMNAAVVNLPGGSSTCDRDGIKDSNEQCDGTSGLSTVSCRSLNFTGGNVSCNSNCRYDTSECYGTTNKCSNGITDITESDVDCGSDCPKACGLNKTCFGNSDCTSNTCKSGKCVVNPCNNSRFDNGTETDVDCGGSCSDKCSNSDNCLVNDDCISGYCINYKCSSDPCMNGIKDAGETDVDCGGSCVSCSVGKKCNTNSDCSTGNCVDSICADTVKTDTGAGMQGLKFILLILGIVFIIGGGGYIAYATFYKKKPDFKAPQVNAYAPEKKTAKDVETAMKMSDAELQRTSYTERAKESLNDRREVREEQRKKMFNILDSESNTAGPDKDRDDAKDDIKSIATRKNVTSLASQKRSIANSTDKNTKDSDGYIELSSIKKKDRKDEGEDAFNRLKSIGKDKKSDAAFERLKEIDKRGTIKADYIAKQIAKVSGASKESIRPALANRLSDKDAIKLFGDIDRSKIMSDVFRDILSHLLESGTITKENVSNILFEYMDRKLLSKGDVAKISSELKLI